MIAISVGQISCPYLRKLWFEIRKDFGSQATDFSQWWLTLSTYLAAGLPVIVNSGTPARDIIEKKNLGIIADSLPEAIDRIQTMTTTEYDQMVNSIDDFAKLIRGGYFVKRALTEAIFKAFYD